MKKIALWAGLWALSLTTVAQITGPVSASTSGSKYDPLALFHPLFNMQPGNDYRTGSGAPGPRYWQNRADYQINVSLDDRQNTITGDVTITYKNNSPESLPFLWLQLDQNAFSDTSRSAEGPPISTAMRAAVLLDMPASILSPWPVTGRYGSFACYLRALWSADPHDFPL